MLAMGVIYMALYPADPPITVIAIPEISCADYNDDFMLAIEDYRLYYLWSTFVDKIQDIASQLTDMSVFYGAIYPFDPSVTAIRRPELLDPSKCEHGWFITPWHDKVVLGGLDYGWLQ